MIEFYNLEAIIFVGYRVNNTQATQFRVWPTQTLREFIVKSKHPRKEKGGPVTSTPRHSRVAITAERALRFVAKPATQTRPRKQR